MEHPISEAATNPASIQKVESGTAVECAQLGLRTPRLYPNARKSFSKSADVVTFDTFLLDKSTVNKSVPLKLIYFPAGTLLYKLSAPRPTHTDLFRKSFVERWILPPISDVGGCIFILLPPYGDSIACVEGEDNVVCHVGHTAASIWPCANCVVQLGAVVDVGGGGAVVGALVIYFDLSSDGVS